MWSDKLFPSKFLVGFSLYPKKRANAYANNDKHLVGTCEKVLVTSGYTDDAKNPWKPILKKSRLPCCLKTHRPKSDENCGRAKARSEEVRKSFRNKLWRTEKREPQATKILNSLALSHILYTVKNPPRRSFGYNSWQRAVVGTRIGADASYQPPGAVWTNQLPVLVVDRVVLHSSWSQP